MAKNQGKQDQATQPEKKDPVELTEEQKQELALQDQQNNGQESNQQLDQGTDGVTQPSVLVLGGFEVSVRLAELLTEEGVDFLLLETKYAEAFKAAEPNDIPVEIPMDPANLPQAAIKRYIEEAKAQGLDLSLVELVIADPQKDATLQSINFLRAVVGQAPTYFYPRIHGVIEV